MKTENCNPSSSLKIVVSTPLHRHFLRGLSLAVAAITVGCAGGNNPDVANPKAAKPENTQTVSGIEFTSLKNGWIYSSQPLSEIESANHYKLTFDIAPGGSVIFSANGIAAEGSDTIDRGIEFEFRRSLDVNEPRLTVLGRASGGEDDWSEHFTSLDARQTVNLGIDVHNNEGDQAHLVAWGVGEEPIFESSSRNVGGAPGRGYGMRWGFKLDQATLQSVALEGPREDHEH